MFQQKKQALENLEPASNNEKNKNKSTMKNAKQRRALNKVGLCELNTYYTVVSTVCFKIL